MAQSEENDSAAEGNDSAAEGNDPAAEQNDSTAEESSDEELQRIREQKRKKLLEAHERNPQQGTSPGEQQPPGEQSTPETPIEITGGDHLETVVREHDVVLLDCYADWCGPCQMMEPVIDDLARTTAAAIAKLDVDANQQLAAQLGARSIPTLVLFVDGEPAERLVGAQNRGALVRLIEGYT